MGQTRTLEIFSISTRMLYNWIMSDYYVYAWGILVLIVGAISIYRVIKNKESESVLFHCVYLAYSILMVCVGILTLLIGKYDSICAILFGLTFLKMTYNDRHTFPPSFTIDYINFLKGYLVGFVSIFYGIFRMLVS